VPSSDDNVVGLRECARTNHDREAENNGPKFQHGASPEL